MIFFMPQLTFLQVDIGNFSVTIFRVLVLLTGIGLIIKVFINKDKLMHSPLDIPVILFIALCVLSIINSQYKLVGATRFIFLMLLFLTTAVIANLIKDKKFLNTLNNTILISCSITVLLVLFEFLVFYKSMFTGIHRLMGGKVGTFYSMPHALARDINTFFPFVLLMTFHVSSVKRVLLIILASLMILILILTSVLAGWLGTIASIAIILIFSALRKQYFFKAKYIKIFLIVFFIGALIVALLAPTQLISYHFKRFSYIFTETESFISGTTRGYVWQTAERVFLDHPLLGVGLGNFPLRYPEYMVAKVGIQEKVFTKHGFNVFVDIGTEVGVFAILVFLWFLARHAKYCIRHLLAIKDPYLGSILLASFAASVAVFVQMQTESGPFWANNFWCMLGLSLATIGIARAEDTVDERFSRAKDL